VLKDTRVGFVERWGRGFGIGDGLVDGWGDGRLGGELDTVMWMEGISRVDYVCDGKGWVGDWVLQDERGFGSALPETGEEHKEETELGEKKHRPDAGLREHVHCGAGGKDDGGESEDSEEEEDGPGLREVIAKSSPCGTEGTEDAAIGFGWFSWFGGAEVEAKLDSVDLDEIEVETKDGGDEEENDVAGEDSEERVAADGVFVDVIGPFVLQEEEGDEDDGRDEDSEESDADEAPKIEQPLVKEGAGACRSFGLVTEECSRNEKEVEDEIERDGGVAEADPCSADGTFVKMEVGFAEGAEVEAAGEALSGEGVIEQLRKLEIEADGEEEGEGEIEEVGPEQSWEAAHGERQAVKEDVLRFRHGLSLWRE
jgi:hypothetical protein